MKLRPTAGIRRPTECHNDLRQNRNRTFGLKIYIANMCFLGNVTWVISKWNV